MNPDNLPPAEPIEPTTPEEEFEKLRQRFHQRLRREQAQWSGLTEALVTSDVASDSLVVAIGAFAHRLRGAALVFGYQSIGDCAKAVELAASSPPSDLGGSPSDQSIASTMEALGISLANGIGAGAPRPPVMTDSIGSSGKSSSW